MPRKKPGFRHKQKPLPQSIAASLINRRFSLDLTGRSRPSVRLDPTELVVGRRNTWNL